MFFRLRRALKVRRFNKEARAILKTPVLRPGGDGPIIVTQLCHNDVLMYLVAIKSFARFVPPSKVCAVDDGSLTADDMALVKQHVEGIELISLDSVPNEKCPKGGCWERILSIVDRAQDHFVIQLDSDTITRSAPEEILECVATNRSFTLGTNLGEKIQVIPEARKITEAQPWTPQQRQHVQVVSELAMDQLKDAANRCYVRGNAAFAGFAPGAISREDVESFSVEMEALLGAQKWSSWGSEQVTSNFVISNVPGALVLPFPKYGYHAPEIKLDDCLFVHFIGTYRFDNGTYGRMSAEVAQTLGGA